MQICIFLNLCFSSLIIKIYQKIYLFFQVEKSKQFRREGADVHSDVTVSFTQAALGGTIRIAGIQQDILLNVSDMDRFFFKEES